MDDPCEFSYLHTSADEPYSNSTVTRIARENARLRPNQEIFVLRELDGSRSSLTNASLYERAEHLAKYLITQGIIKGDVVAIIGPNTLDLVVGMLGIMMAGAVVLNVTINMKSAIDAQKMFHLANVKFLMVDCDNDDYILPAVTALLKHCDVETDSLKGDGRMKLILTHKIDLDDFQNTETFQTIQSRDMQNVHHPHIYPEDNALIFTTSGSTGKPKLVLHSHFGLSCSTFFLTQPVVDNRIILYNDRPFAWSGGSPVFTILRSETRVFMNAYITMNNQNTAVLWRILKEEKCTHALLLPFLIQDLHKLPETATEDGFRLEQITTGGQMINSFYTGVIGRFCRKMMVVYASTEASGITWNGPLGHNDSLNEGDVGRPFPGIEIRVVDNQDIPIQRGMVGKIQIRSQQLMKEYFRNPQLTKAVFTGEKWYRTGDIGKVSSNGHLILLGREVDVISRGTRKIYPGTLELFLKNIKSIKEVFVVPVPDQRLHEEICVCFVPSGQVTADDIRQYCRQNLFKESTVDSLGEMPTYFLKFEAFPKLANGKPDKKAVRQEAIARLGFTEVVSD